MCPPIATIDKICSVQLTLTFPIPLNIIKLYSLVPVNREATLSLINEHSAPESKQNENDSPRWTKSPDGAATAQKSIRRSLLPPLLSLVDDVHLDAICPTTPHLKHVTGLLVLPNYARLTQFLLVGGCSAICFLVAQFSTRMTFYIGPCSKSFVISCCLVSLIRCWTLFVVGKYL